MASYTKTELFEKVPVPHALASMAVPTIISQLVNLVYNVVDTFFIGRTGNAYMMAAVTVAFTLFMMTVAFANLFGIGGGSLIARLSGRHDTGGAKSVCAFSICGAIGISLLYSLLVGSLMEPILTLFGASAETMGFAKQYVWLVVVAGNLPVILSLTLSHLLRNSGYSRQASIGLSGGGVLNIILDPLFMFVLFPSGMEVFGAALATLLSNVASCIYLFIQVARVSKEAPLTVAIGQARKIRRQDLRELFSVGVPSAVLTGLFDVANIFLNAQMSAHGDLQLAGIGIVMKAERLPNAINLGLCQGMLPIVAYNYSSGNRERMRETIKFTRTLGLVVSALCLVGFELLAEPVIRLFMSTSGDTASAGAATVAIAITFLRIRCLASPVQLMNYHTSFCMQAMGDGRDTLLHAVLRELVFYIPLMYLLDALFGQNGLAAALVGGEALGAVCALLLLRSFMKRQEA